MEHERYTVRVVTLTDHRGLSANQALKYIESLGELTVFRKVGKTLIVIPKARLSREVAGGLRG
jgi:hypothetical protein